MQIYALTIDKLLDHAARWSGLQEVVSADTGHGTQRIGYATLRARSNRLSGALQSLGLVLGDRVATLAWNTQHHLEMYYATMGAGMVCHTLNPRYTAAHLAAIINAAQDRALAVAANLAPLLDELLPLCPTLENIIVLDGAAPAASADASPAPSWWELDTLLTGHGQEVPWGNFDESTPAGLCYTSGTTGAPKGVLYTHRSNYLHTLHSLQADAIAISSADTVLAAVPMFHANGWGLPFAAPAVGARLVLPGRHADGRSLAQLMREERVTVAVGVHTLWLGVMDHLDATGGELPDLRRVLIGGSKCPQALIQRMQARLGVQVQTSWGMTELSPVGTIASPYAAAAVDSGSGRPPLGVDLRLVDPDGAVLSPQRGVVGHLRVRGASVLDTYYLAEASALDADGYFDTGDLASIDEAGNVTICGRAKDLIKSGGEWINPAEIEEIVGHQPGIGLVAVIGRPDARWGERPLLVIEAQAGHAVVAQDLLAALKGKVADWWIPDRVEQISRMPLAATGKIDKNQLRVQFSGGGDA